MSGGLSNHETFTRRVHWDGALGDGRNVSFAVDGLPCTVFVPPLGCVVASGFEGYKTVQDGALGDGRNVSFAVDGSPCTVFVPPLGCVVASDFEGYKTVQDGALGDGRNVSFAVDGSPCTVFVPPLGCIAASGFAVDRNWKQAEGGSSKNETSRFEHVAEILPTHIKEARLKKTGATRMLNLKNSEWTHNLLERLAAIVRLFSEAPFRL